ncbi:glycosyltransferase family 25 protein [Mesorhizobium sp. PAMC28654]|uniref:glycosyltransferase family 25 protein n=1 Tax=Mesorhizobium sp. PAMC28654 TaxID=2880934 RepID=UPI001D0B8B3D|nr:glycosyltransferase family 25 protein [Mesorhizobium sp. PAMC28654]UDL92489.1 glycosyltransferase family 25 protein [Mesorhizobium sp. PAMC28654]
MIPVEMKCLVINLDRSRDRLAHITAEFTRIGIAFERVKAIDAQDRPELDHMPQNVPYTQRLRLTGGEIACLLSHRACWTIIASGDASYAAIFEDDVVFSARAGALLGNADWIPADADIIKLETFFQKTMVGRKLIPAGPGFSISSLLADHMGTAGYIVSKRTASDLVEASREISVAVDDLVFNPAFPILPRKTIYQLIPALCVQGQLLGYKTPELPSLLKEKRDMQWAVTATGEKRRKTAVERAKAEVGRLIRHIVDFRRRRQRRVIPFRPPDPKD